MNNKGSDAPSISICMAAYNAEQFIGDALESIIAQTYPPIETIVVDDGSSDKTYDVASRYASKGVKVSREPHRGAAAARNRALQAAKGEWIQFFDADDLMHREKLSLQMARATVLGPTFLYSADWGRFVGVVANAVMDGSPLLRDGAPCEWLITKYSENAMIHSGAWLAHRSLLERAGTWDERLSLNDDGEFFDRLVLCSDGVRHVPGAMVYYRSKVKGSLSGGVSRAAAESALLSMRLCCDRLIGSCDSSESRGACATQFHLLAIGLYPSQRDLAECAARQARELGGDGHVEIPGGKALNVLARAIGWRGARFLQHWYYRLRPGL